AGLGPRSHDQQPLTALIPGKDQMPVGFSGADRRAAAHCAAVHHRIHKRRIGCSRLDVQAHTPPCCALRLSFLSCQIERPVTCCDRPLHACYEMSWVIFPEAASFMPICSRDGMLLNAHLLARWHVAQCPSAREMGVASGKANPSMSGMTRFIPEPSPRAGVFTRAPI